MSQTDQLKYFITKKGEEFLCNYTSGLGREASAKQQILILCSTVQMSVEDLIHDFSIPFDQITDKHIQTKKLFDWIIENIYSLRDSLIKFGYIK